MESTNTNNKNALVEAALESHKRSNDIKNDLLREKVKGHAKFCFGDYSDGLEETDSPLHLRIKGTIWNLCYSEYYGFTIWRKDYPKSSDSNDPNIIHYGKFSVTPINNLESLGEALASVSERWGLYE